jgi:uncharacterized protein YjiS (DUF1127 family)
MELSLAPQAFASDLGRKKGPDPMIPENRIWRTIDVAARRAASWPFRVAAARATLKALANMDRRELADIGLNLSDVRDASALPLDRDPGELLARRAGERWRDAGAARVSRGDDGRRPGPRARVVEPASTALRETNAA